MIILSFYTITCLVSVAYCVPKSGKSWLSLPTLPLCTKMMFDTSSIRGVFSAVSDIYVLCIPTHLVLGLRLQRGRKIGVCAIFLTGLVYGLPPQFWLDRDADAVCRLLVPRRFRLLPRCTHSGMRHPKTPRGRVRHAMLSGEYPFPESTREFAADSFWATARLSSMWESCAAACPSSLSY